MSCNCELTEVGPNNDYVLRIFGLVDADETELNSATITYQIYSSENVLVAGADGALTAEGTDGDYSATIDKTTVNLLSVGLEYTCRVSGEQGGADFEVDLPIIVKRRHR